LASGWRKDADVADFALRLRLGPMAGMQIDAIRLRAARNEADLDDLDIFADLSYGRERLSSNFYALELVEYFASRNKSRLVQHIEAAFKEPNQSQITIPLVESLIVADPSHPRCRDRRRVRSQADGRGGEGGRRGGRGVLR